MQRDEAFSTPPESCRDATLTDDLDSETAIDGVWYDSKDHVYFLRLTRATAAKCSRRRGYPKDAALQKTREALGCMPSSGVLQLDPSAGEFVLAICMRASKQRAQPVRKSSGRLRLCSYQIVDTR